MIHAILALMLSTVPPARIPDTLETDDQTRARYAEIATAIADVAKTPQEAALILAISFHESSWRRDVDLGTLRGEGKDSCMMQLRVGEGSTAEGWTHDDLVKDRRKCFLAGLRLVRRSMGACRSNPTLDRLAAYTSGSCSRGIMASRKRMTTALRFAGMLVP